MRQLIDKDLSERRALAAVGMIYATCTIGDTCTVSGTVVSTDPNAFFLRVSKVTLVRRAE